MSTCHFCGAENEEWMKICQQCGNPIIDEGSKSDDNDNSYEDSSYSDSYDENKPSKGNKDLLLIIFVLSIILAVLLIYTVYVVFF